MVQRNSDIPAPCTDTEWDMRLELAACYRAADHFGFSDIVWNHITAKIPGTEWFLINRFGLRYDEITASNLVTIDLNGEVIEPGSEASEDDVNITGFIIHSAVHAARPDVHCVMHSHSPAGMAVSALKDGLVPMAIDGMRFYNRTAYHEFEGLSMETDERERLAASLGDRDVMILRNHGLLTCADTVGGAFMLMYYLERACAVQMQVQASGQEVQLPAPEICERAALQSLQFPDGKYEWPAIRRLIDQRSPDYRN
jgi:ribulose-5-phosphate 4-epimerase/fuculose-1-phosphate aldolase